MDDVRDRLARAEQDIKNTRENFLAFKQEDFQALKAEVSRKLNEVDLKMDKLDTKIDGRFDQVREQIGKINITLAKWSVGVGAVVSIVQALTKKFIG